MCITYITKRQYITYIMYIINRILFIIEDKIIVRFKCELN